MSKENTPIQTPPVIDIAAALKAMQEKQASPIASPIAETPPAVQVPEPVVATAVESMPAQSESTATPAQASDITQTTPAPTTGVPESTIEPKQDQPEAKTDKFSLLGWLKKHLIAPEKEPAADKPVETAGNTEVQVNQSIEVITASEPVIQPPSLPELVRFTGVTKIFGEGQKAKTVLQDVSFVVHDLPDVGEIIAIVGPSGCGKSTILKCIAGLSPHYPPTAGAISILGEQSTKANAMRGLIDQQYSLFKNRTVVDNVAFGLELRGEKKKDRIEKAMLWIKKVGLDGAEHKYPHELSGGMQQRVAIASTLVLGSRILLMDEPFGALDPKIRLEMQALVAQLWQELEQTIFIITHSMEEAVYLGDRVYRMAANPGRIVEEIQVPRPTIPPQEMRKQKEFQDIVKDLTNKLESNI